MSQSPAPSGVPFWRTRKFWAIVLGAATLVGTLASVLAIPALNKPDLPPPSGPSVGSITQQQGCIDVGTGNSCTIEQQADELSKNAADAAQLQAAVAAVSQHPPQGAGPWPFMVYDTRDGAGNDIGLKIKAEPTPAGVQIGSARGRSLLWVDCYVLNNFKPVPDGSRNDVGPRWLRVHWPTGEPGSDFRDAVATDPFMGYAYAGYALPFYHNGAIPLCT